LKNWNEKFKKVRGSRYEAKDWIKKMLMKIRDIKKSRPLIIMNFHLCQSAKMNRKKKVKLPILFCCVGLHIFRISQ